MFQYRSCLLSNCGVDKKSVHLMGSPSVCHTVKTMVSHHKPWLLYMKVRSNTSQNDISKLMLSQFQNSSYCSQPFTHKINSLNIFVVNKNE